MLRLCNGAAFSVETLLDIKKPRRRMADEGACRGEVKDSADTLTYEENDRVDEHTMTISGARAPAGGQRHTVPTSGRLVGCPTTVRGD